MQSRRTLTLTLSLSEKERGTIGGTVSGAPNRDPRKVPACSPLPARSGERIKVRGASDCILTAKALRGDAIERAAKRDLSNRTAANQPFGVGKPCRRQS